MKIQTFLSNLKPYMICKLTYSNHINSSLFSGKSGSTNYVVRDNGPGCDSGMEVNIQDCRWAANELGFKGIFVHNHFPGAPPGCFVGQDSNHNWTQIYFNEDFNGTLGNKAHKSICKKKNIGRQLIMKIIYISVILLHDY